MHPTIRIVPHMGHGGRVWLWFGAVGAFRPPSTVDAALRAGKAAPVPTSWELSWARPARDSHYWVARLAIDDLAPNTCYELTDTGNPSATHRLLATAFRTLPTALPVAGDGQPPLSVILGSCMYRQTSTGKRFDRIVPRENLDLVPHLKFLCGDQVYVDLPLLEDLPEDEEPLRSVVLDKYRANWHCEDRRGAVPSLFGEFLARGANVFLSDDHEYWNNYPFSQVQLPITHRVGGEIEMLKDVTRDMYRAFQTADGGAPRFSSWMIGRRGERGALEFAALDGRYHRTRGDTACSLSDTEAAVQWVRDLEGPGVLVLSQPPSLEAAGWFAKRGKDASLANFKDYEPLAAALEACQSDCLVLSGDIHRARYIRFYSKRSSGRQATIHEISASPLSLIPLPFVGVKHKFGDGRSIEFPSTKIPGVLTRTGVPSVDGLGRDNYCALRFTALDRAVRVDMTYHSIPQAPRPHPKQIWPAQATPSGAQSIFLRRP